MAKDGTTDSTEQQDPQPNLDLLGDDFDEDAEEQDPTPQDPDEDTGDDDTGNDESSDDERPSGEDQEGDGEDAEKKPDDQNQGKPDPDDKRQDLWDKTLQRIQQAAATFEKAAQNLQSQPTAENKQKAEKAKSKLDELLESSDVDDFDERRGLQTVANELKSLTDQVTTTTADTDKRSKEATEREDRIEAKLFELDFKQNNPDLAGDFTGLREKLVEAVKPYAEEGEGNIPTRVWKRIVDQSWSKIVSEAKAEAKAKAEKQKQAQRSESDTGAETKPEKQPARKPRGTQPIKSKSGASRESPEDDDTRIERLLDKAFAGFKGDS